MASKSGVTIIIAGEDKSGAVMDAVKKHLDEVAVKGKETGSAFTKMADVAKSALGAIGLAFGARELLSGFERMIKSSMDLGVEIGHLAQQTGITTQNLSVLRYMSDQTGISFESLSKGFKKLSTDIVFGTATSNAAFVLLGITQKELSASGGDLYKVMEQVADRFSKMKDGAEKNAISTQLFGRAGQELIPVLNGGAAAIDSFRTEAQQLGVVLDPEMVENLENMHKSVSRLENEWQSFALTLTSYVAPALERVMGFGGPESQQAARAAVMGKTMPDDIYGASNPMQMAHTAAQQKESLQKQLDQVNLSREQRSTLQKRWNDADLHENEAYFSALQNQITDAQVDLNNAQAESHKEGIQEVATTENWVNQATGRLNDLLAKQKDAMDHIDAARKRLIGPGGPDDLTDRAGVGKASSAPVVPGYDPRASNLSRIPGAADAIARQQADAQDAAAAAAQKQQADLKAAQDSLDKAAADQAAAVMATMKNSLPAVVLAAQKADYTAIKDEGEKIGHAVFDPLFNFSETWEQKRKQMVNNLLRAAGELAESQLFGALFGDPEGRGGKGWNGGSWEGNTNKPTARTGLAGEALNGLLGMFHRKPAGVTSNGGLGSGAGTIPSAAASRLQMGNGGTSNGGVQVVVNNNGTPQTATDAQTSTDGAGNMMVQIFMKDLTTNGPMAQGIMGLMSH